MALIDLRQIKNGVQLQNDVNQAKSDISRIESTVIPGVKSELTKEISKKVDQTALDSEKERVDGELALKATKVELSAEQERVNGELAKKAVKADVDSALALKADKTQVAKDLALKADQTALDSGLLLKANVSDVEETVAEIEGKIATKTEKTYVDGELAKKASKTELTEGLATKAEAVHRHNVSGIDGLGTVATLNTGVAEGNVPVLGANGKLAESVIPAIAVNEFHVVVDEEAAMLLEVQNGDIVHIDPTAGGVYKTTGGSTYICVNAEEDTFEKRFRPLNSNDDAISRAEVLAALELKADKTELTSKIGEAKAFATSEAQREAGLVDTKLTSAKSELTQSIKSVDGKVTALDGKVDTAKSELQGNIDKVSAKVTANESAISGLGGRVTANEEAITELRTEIEDKLCIENNEVFVATESQKEVTLERDIKDEKTVKVYVNGFKLSKGEYTILGKVITLVTEKIGYEMGEGFVIEVTYA